MAHQDKPQPSRQPKKQHKLAKRPLLDKYHNQIMAIRVLQALLSLDLSR